MIFKLKPFGILLSIDIVDSVRRLFTEIDNKMPNDFSFSDFRGLHMDVFYDDFLDRCQSGKSMQSQHTS